MGGQEGGVWEHIVRFQTRALEDTVNHDVIYDQV